MTPYKSTSPELTLIKVNEVISYKLYPKTDVAKGLLYILKDIVDSGTHHIYPVGSPNQVLNPVLPDCNKLGINFDEYTAIFFIDYNKRMRVAFDWDGTLQTKEIQDLARLTRDLGHEILIVTSRYDESNIHRYSQELLDSFPALMDYGTLRMTAERMNMKLYYTNMEWKNELLLTLGVDVLIDDNAEELGRLDGSIKGFNANALIRDWGAKEEFLQFLYQKVNNE